MRLRKILSYYICLSLAGCSSPKNHTSNKIQDSTNSTISINSNEYDIDLKEVKKGLIESYSKTLLVDTSFTDKKDKYKIVFKHFCTMDNALTIPAKYDYDTHKDFMTSSFKSNIVLIKNNDTILNKDIDKSFFKKLLSPELDSFAILLFPYFKLSNDTIEIHYSISIPVTDIGIPAVIKFDKNGKYYIEN